MRFLLILFFLVNVFSVTLGSEECWEYGPWSPCSITCGGYGEKTREPVIKQSYEGEDCDLPVADKGYCEGTNYPCPCDWSWSDWSPCSSSCGGGHKTRHPIVTKEAGRLGNKTGECELPSTNKTEDCNAVVTRGVWSSWSECGAQHGDVCDKSGARTKTRNIINEHGDPCNVDDMMMTEDCNRFYDLSFWSQCYGISKSMAIAAPCALGLVIVLVVALVVWCICRRKSSKEGTQVLQLKIPSKDDSFIYDTYDTEDDEDEEERKKGNKVHRTNETDYDKLQRSEENHETYNEEGSEYEEINLENRKDEVSHYSLNRDDSFDDTNHYENL